jgi:hypothetical protein
MEKASRDELRKVCEVCQRTVEWDPNRSSRRKFQRAKTCLSGSCVAAARLTGETAEVRIAELRREAKLHPEMTEKIPVQAQPPAGVETLDEYKLHDDAYQSGACRSLSAQEIASLADFL